MISTGPAFREPQRRSLQAPVTGIAAWLMMIIIKQSFKIGEIIRETGQEPFLRIELFDSAIMVRLRYQTMGKAESASRNRPRRPFRVP